MTGRTVSAEGVETIWVDDTPFCPVCGEILDQEDQDFDDCATCGRDEDYFDAEDDDV